MERCTSSYVRIEIWCRTHHLTCRIYQSVSVSSKTSTAARQQLKTKHKMCFDSCQVSTAAAAAPAPAPPMPVPADCGALVVWTCVAWAKCGGVSGRGALLGQHPHWHLRHQLDDCLFVHRHRCAPWNVIADSCRLLTLLLRIHFNSPSN